MPPSGFKPSWNPFLVVLPLSINRDRKLKIRGLYLGGLIHHRPQDRRGEVETLLEEGGVINYQRLALPTFKNEPKSALLGAPRFWCLFGVFG